MNPHQNSKLSLIRSRLEIHFDQSLKKQTKLTPLLLAQPRSRVIRREAGYFRLAAAIGLTWLECFDGLDSKQSQ